MVAFDWIVDKSLPVMDIRTPRNVQMCAMFGRSFAYFTVKERLPIIVTKVIDHLSKDREAIAAEFGVDALEDVKTSIGYLSKLKNEIQTNKRMLALSSTAAEAQQWNSLLDYHTDPYYFTAVWLFTECYVYTRIREAFQITKSLQNFDPFRVQKDLTFHQSLEAMCLVGDHLTEALTNTTHVEDNFLRILRMTLWGNKCDLSLSAGSEVNQASNPMAMVDLWRDNLIVDHSQQVYRDLLRLSEEAAGKEVIVDIVCDNAGYELFMDLCFADFLLTHKLATRVRFRVKGIPWFVSDVILRDFFWTLHSASIANVKIELNKAEDGTPKMLTSDTLNLLGSKWKGYVEEGTWSVQVDSFWTTPHEFHKMKEVDRDLYQALSQATMIFFKGDLNYRKLMAEVNWPPTTPFETALQEFFPGPLVAVRTVKADLISGLPPGKMEELNEKDEKWMEKGDYGVIQYCSKKIILEHMAS